MIRFSTILLICLTFIPPTYAKTLCNNGTTSCLIEMIEDTVSQISEPRWRNQAYRDLAISKGFKGNYDAAALLVNRIDNPDTQAMTIRAIGMAIAIKQDLSDTTYKRAFARLDKAAQTITNEGAKDIAYTYIAMAQAFAGLDNDATKTTIQMTNPALRHKAYAETAEIQAERGADAEALKSINAIESVSFKNKALGVVASIYIKKEKTDKALELAMMITNPTKKAHTLQKILNHQQGLSK
jgi:hypothetical protein